MNDKITYSIYENAIDDNEAESCIKFIGIMEDCLKKNKIRRYNTAWGDKTELGLYRSLRRWFKETCDE